jgi:hypothetical protein
MENQTEVTELSVIDKALVQENVTDQVLAALKENYLALKIGSIDDVQNIDAVEKAKKECSRLRNLAISICKKGREDAIKTQKDWITKEKEVVAQITAVEDHLKGELKRIEDEKERVLFDAAQRGKLPIRKARLDTIGVSVTDEVLLGCNDEQFIALFNDLHSQKLQEQSEKIKIEQERLDKIKREEEQKETARVAEEKRQKELAEAAEVARLEAEHKANVEAERKAMEAAEALRKAEEARVKAERQLFINSRIARLDAIGVHEVKGMDAFRDEYGVCQIPLTDIERLQDEPFDMLLLNIQNALYESRIAREEKAKAHAEEMAKIEAEAEAERRREELKALNDGERWAEYLQELQAVTEKYNGFKSSRFKSYYRLATSHIDQINKLNPKGIVK